MPAPPIRTSSPSPPSATSGSRRPPGRRRRPRRRPRAALTVRRSLAATAPVTLTRGGEAERPRRRRCRRPTLTTSSPLVALTMTVSAAPSSTPPVPARSAFTVVEVGARQVVDGQDVGAAERLRRRCVSTSLRSMTMLRDVAGEADAPAVGRDVDVLVDVRAVEQHRVGAVLALDDVAAVARIPLERVVAGAQERGVVALACRRRSRCRRRRAGCRRRCCRGACRCRCRRRR